MFYYRFCQELLAKLELIDAVHKVFCGNEVSAGCRSDAFDTHCALALVSDDLFNPEYLVASCYIEAVGLLSLLDAGQCLLLAQNGMTFRRRESYRSKRLILLALLDCGYDLSVVSEDMFLLCIRRSVWFHCPLRKFKFSLCDEVDSINIWLSLKVHTLAPRKIDWFHELEYLLYTVRSEALKDPELPQKLHCALQSPSLLLAYDPYIIFPRQGCEAAVCLAYYGRCPSLLPFEQG